MKKIFFFVLVLIATCLLVSGSVFAAYDYEINSYDVSITVNEDNTYDVVETVGVNFNIKASGIVRLIPIENKISYIMVNDKFAASTETLDGQLYEVIQIGDPYIEKESQTEYVIEYRCTPDENFGKDGHYDFSIIDSGWPDTEISNISFMIKMPVKDNQYIASYGASLPNDTGELKRELINGNTIMGSYDGIILSSEQFTVDVDIREIPEARDGIIKEQTDTNSYNSSNYDYIVKGYDVNIKVNENNTLDITEVIDVYFNEYRHGIYRDIPLANNVVRLDGTKSRNRAKLSNISVSEQFSLSTITSGGFPGIASKELKIGDPNETIIGDKQYIIKYTYNLGKDTGKGYDELYFNIIGSGWDNTQISGVTFAIEMPKEFDVSKLGFSAGKVGSTDSSGVDYSVDGNIITGSYGGVLYNGDALTVRLELPEGYYVGAGDNLDFTMWLVLFLPILFAVITFFMWLIYGKGEKPIETVEFYPPEGFNSAEVGFLYKGQASNEDVVSLVVYLANAGYIKIVEYEQKVLFSTKKSFKFVKLKEYDGTNKIEKRFMDGLFSYARSEATEYSLRNSFYVTLRNILSSINSTKNKSTIYEENSLNKKVPIILMMLATFVIITIKPFTDTYGLFEGLMISLFALVFPGIGFAVIFNALFSKTPIAAKIFMLIWGSLFGGLPWLSLVLPQLLSNEMYLITYLVGIICIVIMYILLRKMPKRTEYGNEMLGKIKGFRNFLKHAENPELETLVMQHPTYFYDILPFTYVLGVSKKWIEKFETIIYKPPNWYEGSGAFEMATFSSFMNSTMSSATSSMSSSPSFDSGGSGGGSSGGGSSGGGSGGGGGGSW